MNIALKRFMRSGPAAHCPCARARAPHHPRCLQMPARVVRFAAAALEAMTDVRCLAAE